jgi:ABC-2 type transport system permease protein
MLLCAGFGSATTAVSVADDLNGGIIDRFRSLDVSGTALLNGHVAASVGVLARSTETASGFTFFIMFLPYASSAFVPIDTMP